jgi:hypothetical protein
VVPRPGSEYMHVYNMYVCSASKAQQSAHGAYNSYKWSPRCGVLDVLDNLRA